MCFLLTPPAKFCFSPFWCFLQCWEGEKGKTREEETDGEPGVARRRAGQLLTAPTSDWTVTRGSDPDPRGTPHPPFDRKVFLEILPLGELRTAGGTCRFDVRTDDGGSGGLPRGSRPAARVPDTLECGGVRPIPADVCRATATCLRARGLSNQAAASEGADLRRGLHAPALFVHAFCDVGLSVGLRCPCARVALALGTTFALDGEVCWLTGGPRAVGAVLVVGVGVGRSACLSVGRSSGRLGRALAARRATCPAGGWGRDSGRWVGVVVAAVPCV